MRVEAYCISQVRRRRRRVGVGIDLVSAIGELGPIPGVLRVEVRGKLELGQRPVEITGFDQGEALLKLLFSVEEVGFDSEPVARGRLRGLFPGLPVLLEEGGAPVGVAQMCICLLYTSPSPRDS